MRTYAFAEWVAWLMVVALVMALGGGLAMASGGKNRLSEIRTDIDELYVLCEQAGVRRVTLSVDGVSVEIECLPVSQAEEDGQ